MESIYRFGYNFVGSLSEKEETVINVEKTVTTEELFDLAQAFHEFLLEAGFPTVELVKIRTAETTYASGINGCSSDDSSGS